MAKTYTENLNLELQEDSTDYLDFGAITRNWQKIDAAFGQLLASANQSDAAQSEEPEAN